jgi:hypothetical protein
LSYVWNQSVQADAPRVTATGELSTIFPRTIRDAITVSRKLGLRYLWDQYCIPQDNEDERADWTHGRGISGPS